MIPGISHFITRPDVEVCTPQGPVAYRGEIVPLIPMDMLPDWLFIDGIPRALRKTDTAGMISVGESPLECPRLSIGFRHLSSSMESANGTQSPVELAASRAEEGLDLGNGTGTPVDVHCSTCSLDEGNLIDLLDQDEDEQMATRALVPYKTSASPEKAATTELETRRESSTSFTTASEKLSDISAQRAVKAALKQSRTDRRHGRKQNSLSVEISAGRHGSSDSGLCITPGLQPSDYETADEYERRGYRVEANNVREGLVAPPSNNRQGHSSDGDVETTSHSSTSSAKAKSAQKHSPKKPLGLASSRFNSAGTTKHHAPKGDGKKHHQHLVYCRDYLKTGRCSEMGTCPLEHQMPKTYVALRHAGMKDYPIWYRNMYGANLVPSEKKRYGPKKRAVKWNVG